MLCDREKKRVHWYFIWYLKLQKKIEDKDVGERKIA